MGVTETPRHNQGPLFHSASARAKTLFLGASNRRKFPEYAGAASGAVVAASVLSLDYFPPSREPTSGQVATTHTTNTSTCASMCAKTTASHRTLSVWNQCRGSMVNGNRALESCPDLRLPLHCVQIASELDQHVEDTHTDHEDGNGESYLDDETSEEWTHWGYSSLQYYRI